MLLLSLANTKLIFTAQAFFWVTRIMKYWLTLSLFLCMGLLQAQDMALKTLVKETEKIIKKPVDTTKWTWKRGGLINVNLTQGSLSNWASGGDKFSLAINTYFNYFQYYKKGKYTWDNNLDVYLGFVKTTSLGSRKNDDRIDLVSKSGYEMTKKLYASALFNFRSQLFNGYTYGANNTATFASTILSPAYIFLSAGVDYRPNTHWSIFFSPLTSRWTIVMDKELSDRGAYGVQPGKHTINALGALASVNYNQEIAKNVTYRGRIDLFSNYRTKTKNVDLFMTNNLSFKINKYLSASYNLDLIYDDDIRIFGSNNNSAALQVKSILGIGFTTPLKEKKK